MIEQFLTTEQVASILQVHPFTILKFLKEGKLKGIKLGRIYRIKESDVHEFLEHRSTSNSKAHRKSHIQDPEQEIASEESPALEPQPAMTPEPQLKTPDHHYQLESNKNGEQEPHYYII